MKVLSRSTSTSMSRRMGWPFALKRRRNTALGFVVSATGVCLDSCSINRPFLAVLVAKTDVLGKQENSRNIIPGQGINDTATGGGAKENVRKEAVMAETRGRRYFRCHRKRSVGPGL